MDASIDNTAPSVGIKSLPGIAQLKPTSSPGLSIWAHTVGITPMDSKSTHSALPFPSHSIFWRRLDHEGFEGLQLGGLLNGWRLAGTALFLREGIPCQVSYEIACNAKWAFRKANIHGWMGNVPLSREVLVNDSRQWLLHGEPQPEVLDCIDLDMQFTASTNTIPFRRLNLEIGERAMLQTAWLRFPDFRLERRHQAYTRMAGDKYLYERLDGSGFKVELAVDACDVIQSYPGLCIAVPTPECSFGMQ
ncbi:putative glycolipid-binding domain-containing protein [Mesoterricola silvestris]|nr:putative glycolipid-binding domain-containing protein [Mesoterricola silvestris]